VTTCVGKTTDRQSAGGRDVELVEDASG
jgi:hypothetical protein